MKTVAILAALAVATEARFKDVQAYETFEASTCITASTTMAGAVHAGALTLTLTLDLTVDRTLFHNDWQRRSLRRQGSFHVPLHRHRGRQEGLPCHHQRVR
jgi:hypothetical protein